MMMRRILPDGLRHLLETENLREIRLRTNRHITLNVGGNITVTRYVATKEDLLYCVKNACNSSIYAFIDEIKNGFVTIKGGHRIGVCGKVIIRDNKLENIVDFNGVNIRIAREVKGCANDLGETVKDSTLVISPPGCGKTTMLRDISRILGEKNNVSVVDERGEIAGCYNGIPQFDVGEMTDVLDLCPKKYGIELVLRAMSPDYIITDEIGKDDITSIKKGILCGVKFIASAHGSSIEEVIERLDIDKNTFSNYILLGQNAKVIKQVKAGDINDI